MQIGEICGTPIAVMAQEMLALEAEYRKIEKMLAAAIESDNPGEYSPE